MSGRCKILSSLCSDVHIKATSNPVFLTLKLFSHHHLILRQNTDTFSHPPSFPSFSLCLIYTLKPHQVLLWLFFKREMFSSCLSFPLHLWNKINPDVFPRELFSPSCSGLSWKEQVFLLYLDESRQTV